MHLLSLLISPLYLNDCDSLHQLAIFYDNLGDQKKFGQE